ALSDPQLQGVVGRAAQRIAILCYQTELRKRTECLCLCDCGGCKAGSGGFGGTKERGGSSSIQIGRIGEALPTRLRRKRAQGLRDGILARSAANIRCLEYGLPRQVEFEPGIEQMHARNLVSSILKRDRLAEWNPRKGRQQDTVRKG